MKRILAASTVLMLAVVSSSYGTVYFRNSGNLSGWNNTSTDNNCYLSAVSSPSYGTSGGSIEAQCEYAGSGVRYHAEPTTYGTWNSGTKYFGYALYLDPSWNFNGTDRNVTEQYGTVKSTGGVIHPDNYQAWLKNNSYQFTAINGSDENSGTISSAGTWHTIVTKVTYGSGGNITVWFDGNQAWSVNGTIVGNSGGVTNGLWALGLYEADWDGGNTGNGTAQFLYDAAVSIASSYNEADPIQNFGGGGGATLPSGNWELQNEASGLVLNMQGATTNGSPITQWSQGTSQNLQWSFSTSGTHSGYYQIVSVKSGLDAVVKGASTADGAGIVQWSFGSSGNDQWKAVQNSDGSYTFYNYHSGLVLEDPGSSKSTSTQMDQWSASDGSNQKWQLVAP